MPRPSPADPAPRPTLRMIAEAGGVSAMTVSRALRNSPRVTAPLRRKIQKLAEKLGYRPDPTVTKLMSHLRFRNKTSFVSAIAAITSIPEALEPHLLRNLREGARLRAEELGYRLELFRIVDPTRFNRQLERTLISRGIEGVLLLQMERPVAVDHLLGWEKFAAAVATPSVLSPEFPRVAVNHFHNARLLCAELARRGRRRIGFVGSRTFCLRTHDAFNAAIAWHNLNSGGGGVGALIFDTQEEAERAVGAWFDKERPDVIVAHAENLLPMLEEKLGLRPGGPVMLACSSVSASAPVCPGIDERHELIGRKAVDVLTGLLNRNERQTVNTHSSTLIEGRWVEPPGTAPATAGGRARRPVLR